MKDEIKEIKHIILRPAISGGCVQDFALVTNSPPNVDPNAYSRIP